MTTWKIEDLAYLAGFIDGEGAIHFNYSNLAPTARTPVRNFPLVSAYVRVSNTQRDVIDWVGVTFEARVREERSSTYRVGWRASYYATWTSDQLLVLIPAVLPYIKIADKRRQLEIVLLFFQTYRGKRHTGEAAVLKARQCLEWDREFRTLHRRSYAADKQ